jgi:pimeloyl-ACP methyl ester carboxylesterase
MLHGSPGDSAILAHEMAVLAERFTCFALDTPGFGGSDPLPGETLKVSDLAGATAAAMTALSLPPCRVYGTHTGAAIALELGVGWPDQATGLVLEGVPMFTQAEIDVLFVGYFAPMIPDPLGGHLTQTWMRFRDQFTWFPWLSRDVTRLNPVDRPTPEEIEVWVSMFYRSCRTYGPAYKAACYYGPLAFAAVQALKTPAIFMASAEDMLFPHLDRLPPLKDGQEIARLPYDAAAKYAAIADFAARLPGGAATPGPAPAGLAGANPAKGYVATPWGQIFVRAYGEASRPAVVLLHDGLGTGLMLEALARDLAAEAYVVVPDMPGVGASDAPDEDRPILTACGEAVESVIAALGLDGCLLAASGAGAAVAAEVFGRGSRARSRFRAALVLDRPPLALAADIADQIAPDIPLSPLGAHWLQAWLMIRDGEIYDPWFDGRVAAQRPQQGRFDAAWLHDQTVALMESRETYFRYPRAAVRADPLAALAVANITVTLAAPGDFQRQILASLQQTGKPHG